MSLILEVMDMLVMPVALLLFLDVACQSLVGSLVGRKLLPLTSAYLRLLWAIGTGVVSIAIRLVAALLRR